MRALKTKGIRAIGERSGAKDKYFSEISRIPRITADEEAAIAAKLRQGDRAALEKLVNPNLGFVVSVAQRYQGKGLDLDDLINEGNLGLLEAAKRFDETRGFKLNSYAVWYIRDAIQLAIAEFGNCVHLPLDHQRAMSKLKKSSAEFQRVYDYNPTAKELAEFSGMKENKIFDILFWSKRLISLQAPFTEEGGSNLLDMLDSGDKSTDYDLLDESLKKNIDRMLSKLDRRRRDIMILHFGLYGKSPMEIENIAVQYGLTYESIRKIIREATEELKEPANKLGLRSYLD